MLFADANHRRARAANNFRRYCGFLVQRGLDLWQDITPDQGDGWLQPGGVPTSWQEVESLYPRFIPGRQQKAFGICLLNYSAATVELLTGFGRFT